MQSRQSQCLQCNRQKVKIMGRTVIEETNAKQKMVLKFRLKAHIMSMFGNKRAKQSLYCHIPKSTAN